MDVLVLGGTGLISTAIVRQLTDHGHRVTTYTRGETAATLPATVRQLHGDRNDTAAFQRTMGAESPDCVIDMICFTGAQAKQTVAAFKNRIDRLIFCSTVDVYERPPPKNPVTETSPRTPASEYAAGKISAEDVFTEADADGAFDVVTVRPWNTYGESGTLVHTFGMGTSYLDRIRRGKPIVVHGDGTGLWGPCHRDDVASAFVGAVEADGVGGNTYNVTSEETMTWNQYHKHVASALDAPEPVLVHIPTGLLLRVAPDRTTMLRDHFQYSTVFDNSAAKADLGFTYTVEFESGVQRTVAWLDDHDEITTADATISDDDIIAAWRAVCTEFEQSVPAGNEA